MTRKKRVWYPGAEYHIMTRGNRRSDVFRNCEDFEEYLKIVFDAKLKAPFKLFADCLMDNHIHIQIRTIDRSLSDIMQSINTLFSSYFNETYKLLGTLFKNGIEQN